MSGFDDDFGEMVESKAEANLMVSLIILQFSRKGKVYFWIIIYPILLPYLNLVAGRGVSTIS